MLLIEEDTGLGIDELVVIPCPKVDFKTVRARSHCSTCEHYKGLGIMRRNKFKEVQNTEGVFEMSDNELEEWNLKYAIRCAHVIERRTYSVPEIIE